MNRLYRLLPLLALVVIAACAPPPSEDVGGDIDPIGDGGGNPLDEVAPSGIEPLFDMPTPDTLFNPPVEVSAEATFESTAETREDPLFNTAIEVTVEVTIEATPEATAESTAEPGELFGANGG